MAERITIQLVGSPDDAGRVRLSDFITQLEAIRAALRQTERTISRSEDPGLYYRVVDLRYSSPATVVIEPTPIPRKKPGPPLPDFSNQTVERFIDNLETLRTTRTRPNDMDLQALEAYRNLGAVLDKHVSELTIHNGKATIPIDKSFTTAVDDVIGPDEFYEGSVTGSLEKINLHNTTRFDIFPDIGPRQVVCDFPSELRSKVVAALDQYVTVYGRLRYKRFESFAHAITIDEIEVHPPDNELPSLFDIRGIAPDITGRLSTEDFVYSVSDADQ